MCSTAYVRNQRSNLVVPVSAIMCISAPINPDNTYSYKYSSDVNGQNTIYLSTTTYPDAVTALEAGYNNLVIELP